MEDDESVSELLRTICGSVMSCYRTLCARDGEEALAMARVDVPDIILLDINLPGLNGYEVCRLVKADPNMSETKVVMITGMAQTCDLLKAKKVGADDYLIKPFRATALVEKVESLLKDK